MCAYTQTHPSPLKKGVTGFSLFLMRSYFSVKLGNDEGHGTVMQFRTGRQALDGLGLLRMAHRRPSVCTRQPQVHVREVDGGRRVQWGRRGGERRAREAEEEETDREEAGGEGPLYRHWLHPDFPSYN